METYRATHHAHQRARYLTKLYSDTKKSALGSVNAYSGANEQFPVLHRKYRIQKDRLITWGLAWSDDEKDDDGNIDDAVARAGLTETVDSVLNNIKEVTQEAERLHYAAQPHGFGDSKIGSSKPVTFDQARYEDLLQDLTTSIDTLYDLSRSRKALARGEHPSFTSSATEKSSSAEKALAIAKSQFAAPSFAGSDATLVNPQSFQRPCLSPYAGLPPRIEKTALRLPEEGPPPYEALGVPSTIRLVAYLSRSKVPEIVQNALGSGALEVPVLVEYATFDSVYRDTHVPPPLQRLETLASYFQPMRPESQHNLSLLGYFEDSDQPRIGLVYDVPYSIQNRFRGTAELSPQVLTPVSLLKLVQKSNKAHPPNGDVSIPALESRFRLALRLVEQLHDLHVHEIPHGNINSSSVIFTPMAGEAPLRQGHMRSPLWASFDVFSKCTVEGIRRDINLNIYRHPEDHPHDANRDVSIDINFDLYSLALVLLEVGLWTPIGDLYKAKYSLEDFKLRLEKLWIPKLSSRCGSAYTKVVQTCFRMADDPDLTYLTLDGLYNHLLDKLCRCCLLDDDESSADPLSTQNSFSNSVLEAYGDMKNTRSDISPERSPMSRQFSDHRKLLRQFSASSLISTTPPRMSLVSDAPEYVPSDRTSTLPLPPSRQPSLRSQISQRSTMSQMRDRLSVQPSFKEYKRKVTLIQQRWRERCAQCREVKASQERNDTSLSQQRDAEQPLKPKRREFRHLRIPQQLEDEWRCSYAYQLVKLGERALRGSTESSHISLVMYGESEETARPTFLFECERSTAKAKQVLKRHFKYDPKIYDLRVKKCDPIRRSRRSKRYGDSAAYRSMAPVGGTIDKAANPDYQQRPLCGASIGAYRDDEHLPPVSFGGIVLVDGAAYGMSVHHMLEAEDEEEEEDIDADATDDNDSDTSSVRSSDNVSVFSHSDDESTIRPLSTFLEPDEPDDCHEGDVLGITPEDFEDITITQPALDDAIDCDLHVDIDDDDEEDSGIDEDHLLSYKLGQIHASSGLKRSLASTQDGFKSIALSLPQEIDWALFELLPPRVHPYNVLKGASKYCAAAKRSGDVYPVAIRQSSELACAKVHCIGRTSGLASGIMSSTMEPVKIRGRSTFSASWTVDGDFGVGGQYLIYFTAVPRRLLTVYQAILAPGSLVMTTGEYVDTYWLRRGVALSFVQWTFSWTISRRHWAQHL